jgi:hypothetical protein
MYATSQVHNGVLSVSMICGREYRRSGDNYTSSQTSTDLQTIIAGLVNTPPFLLSI